MGAATAADHHPFITGSPTVLARLGTGGITPPGPGAQLVGEAGDLADGAIRYLPRQDRGVDPARRVTEAGAASGLGAAFRRWGHGGRAEGHPVAVAGQDQTRRRAFLERHGPDHNELVHHRDPAGTQTGPGWTTTADTTGREHGPGWFTLIEKVAVLGGEGALSANIATTYPNRVAALAGSGALTATVAPVKTVTAAFSATGALTATRVETKAVTAAFGATGGLTTTVNDGFWCVIVGGQPLTDGLSAIVVGGVFDGLTATVTAVAGAVPVPVAAGFAASGGLTATVLGYQVAEGFLTATVKPQAVVAAPLTGAGSLAATGYPQAVAAAALAGTGSLAATVAPIITTIAAFAGAGSLTATVSTAAVSIPATAAFTGSGSLTATVSPQAVAAAALAATGALSATVTPLLTAALAGAGSLTATGVQQFSVAAAFGDIPGIVSTNSDLTAEGMFTATVTKATTGITDDFNRANSSTGLGSNWTNRNAVMGVSSNTAYGVNAGAWNLASHNTTMASDDMEASMTLGPYSGTQDYTMVLIGNNTAGEGVFVYTNEVGANFNICSQPDWTVNNYAVQASSPFATWTAGDMLKIKRVGNVYTVYLNNISQVSWIDTTNVVPRDSSHRLVAIGAYNNGSGSRTIDSFAAQ